MEAVAVNISDYVTDRQEMVLRLRQQKVGGISPFISQIPHRRRDEDLEEICGKCYPGGGSMIVCVLDKRLQPVYFVMGDFLGDVVATPEAELPPENGKGWSITWWNVDRPNWTISDFILDQRRRHDIR